MSNTIFFINFVQSWEKSSWIYRRLFLNIKIRVTERTTKTLIYIRLLSRNSYLSKNQQIEIHARLAINLFSVFAFKGGRSGPQRFIIPLRMRCYVCSKKSFRLQIAFEISWRSHFNVRNMWNRKNNTQNRTLWLMYCM